MVSGQLSNSIASVVSLKFYTNVILSEAKNL